MRKFKAYIKEMIDGESIPLSEAKAFATNMGADDCTWHPRDKFESCDWFRLIAKICISDEQDHQLWALLDDGGGQGSRWFPVEVWLDLVWEGEK